MDACACLVSHLNGDGTRKSVVYYAVFNKVELTLTQCRTVDK